MTNPPQDPYQQPQSPQQWPPTQPMPPRYTHGQAPADPYAGQTQQMPSSPPPGQPWPPTQQMPAVGYPQQPPGQYPPSAYPPAPPIPAQAKKGMSTGKLLLIIGAGLVGLCCVGGIVGAIVSPPSTKTASNSAPATKAAAAPTTPKAAPTTTKPAPPAPTTKAAAPKPPPPGAALVAWWVGGGQDKAQAIGNDFNQLSTAAGNNDYPAVRAACSQAQQDVEAAQAYGQVPDAKAQQLWASALASYARASSDCIAGIDTDNSDLVMKSGNEIGAGNDSIHQLADRIRQMGNGG